MPCWRWRWQGVGLGREAAPAHAVPVVHSSAPVEVALYPIFACRRGKKPMPRRWSGRSSCPAAARHLPRPQHPRAAPYHAKGQFQLLGTIITDEMRIAVVKEISSGKERQIVQGYTINGLQLEMVEADRIVFTQYEDREEIRLKIQRSSKPVAKPVSAPPAGQPARLQAAPATPTQPAGPAQGAGFSAGRIERPASIILPPQTVEDRKRDPLLKDFYK